MDVSRSSIDRKYAAHWNHSIAIDKCHVARARINNRNADAWFEMEFRVYDSGIAYRYIVPGSEEVVVTRESSTWNLPDGCHVWHQSNLKDYEGEFYRRRIDKIFKGQSIGLPITIELPDNNCYAAITEGALFDFSGVNLRSDDKGASRFSAEFSDDRRGWVVDGQVKTPWRITIVAKDLNGLVNSDIVSNVNENPGELFEDSETWIKPGRALWSWLNGARGSVTPENMRRYVDAAAELGWEYVLVDEGWEESPPIWSPSTWVECRWQAIVGSVEGAC